MLNTRSATWNMSTAFLPSKPFPTTGQVPELRGRPRALRMRRRQRLEDARFS
jgi:hypothetical protein